MSYAKKAKCGPWRQQRFSCISYCRRVVNGSTSEISKSAPTCASTDFKSATFVPNKVLADGKETFSFPSPSVLPAILLGVCRSNVNVNLSVWNTLGFSPGTLVARRPPPNLSIRWRVFLAISLFCESKTDCACWVVKDHFFGEGNRNCVSAIVSLSS